jgi:NTE family protein
MSKTTRPTAAPPNQPIPDKPTIALVLQGGGALGAYQGGAFEALAEANTQPNWIAGISIGAINAAIIAGNAPEQRVDRLRAFWERVSNGIPAPVGDSFEAGPLRGLANGGSAAWAMMFGLPAFFAPKPGALLWPGLMPEPSFYDTSPLRQTLLDLVDFDRLNSGEVRLSVSAVDVESGNFVDFDTAHQRLGPEHIMASGALPPGFPAVVIDGRAYWDGGLVSNTPLRHVVDNLTAHEATIYQVDLFSARGPRPKTLEQVAERDKDIRYSSRTRMVTDLLAQRQEGHRRLRALAALLPAARREQADVQQLLEGTKDPAITLVHLIHRHKGSETQNKDYEFSAVSMREHWSAGHHDMKHSLAALAKAPKDCKPGEFRVYDLNPDPTRSTRS